MPDQNLQSSIAESATLVASRYGTAIVSQGLVSGFHFILNLILVRGLSTEGFGNYALIFVVAILFSSVVNSLAATPLGVYAPGSKTVSEKKVYESTFNTLMIYLLLTIFFIGLLVLFFFTPNGSFIPSILNMLFVLFFGARQYSRSLGYSIFDVKSVLYADVLYVFSGSIFVTIAMLLEQDQSTTMILGGLAIANFLAISCEVYRFDININIQPLTELRANYRVIWEK